MADYAQSDKTNALRLCKAAAVALKPGAAAAAEELVAFVSERIASYKKPQAVVFLDAIPKTAVGKINRKAVRTLLNKEQ